VLARGLWNTAVGAVVFQVRGDRVLVHGRR